MIETALITAGIVYFIASLLLFVLGSNLAFLSSLVWRRPRLIDRAVAAPAEEPVEWPLVTVQLPIYNELYVAERVIRAAARLDYPADRLEIQVLDDSTDETADLVAHVVDDLQHRGIDVVHVRRSERDGYKAGALAAGLKVAKGEFMAIFDADFIPRPDFLRRTVGEFSDPGVAFVQGRWGHVNRNYSLITRLQSLAIDAHFMVEQSARKHLGFWFNFNGTAGIWRATAIEDAGGWTADTLTEDLDLSYRAHLRGWRGQYLADVDVPGELPAQMSSFRRQQHRWARGSLECAHKLLPSIWRSDAPWPIKFQATAHLTAYSIHLLLFAVALSYPLVVFGGIRYDGFTTLYGLGYLFALSSLSPGIFFITGQHQLSRPWIRELPKILAVTILGSGLMINTVRAAIQIFTRPNPEFERTAKFGMEEGGSVIDLDSLGAGQAGAEHAAAAPQGGNSWLEKRYQLDLDRIVYAEVAFGCYSLISVFLAWEQGNWGIFLYASVFAAGLLAVAGITVAQAVAVKRARAVRSDRVEAERGLWSGYDGSVSETDHRRAILIMAKQPIPGASKTRLQPAVSADEAADLARCFLLDAVELCRDAAAGMPDTEVRVAGAPATAGPYFAELVPGVGFVAQLGDDLSDRLDHVLTEAIGEGFDQAVAINSDSPTMPAALLLQAFDHLDRPDVDVVLGPAEDGGYYLIGWKRPNDRLVRSVEMSTPTVLADTLAIAAEEGLTVELLTPWYDVDEPVDLERLRADLDGGGFCGQHTARFLADRPGLGDPTSQLR